MMQPQELPKHAPYFGAPKALRRQNKKLATLFSAGTMSPVDAAEVLDHFWQIYDSAVESMGSELKQTELAKLTWCFGLERNGRRILDDVNATFSLLAWLQQRHRRSHLRGLRYSFFHGYQPGSTAFEMLRSALRQMLAQLDWRSRDNQQWKLLAEILPTKSHLVLARWVIADDIPYGDISRRFSVPKDSTFYRYIRNALVDAIISARRVKDKAESLLRSLTSEGDIDAIKHAIEQLLFYYQDAVDDSIDTALVDFALGHLGDVRTGGNSLYWLGVDKRARDLFSRWLSIIDLQVFSDQMAADGGWKAFWLEYLDSIEYSRVIVGSGTREQVEGLLGQGRYGALTDGAAEQNALILKIGELVIVECIGEENRRYVYDARAVPFPLNAESYQVSELCHPNAIFKGHLTTGWQSEFATMLHDHFGIYRHQSRRRSVVQQRRREMWRRRPAEANLEHAIAAS